ncbi:hypothetical protein KJ903_03540 [Patescibacteria group bacterium]|nr:hypothetical protein [Patescibacteria group bacterium]
MTKAHILRITVFLSAVAGLLALAGCAKNCPPPATAAPLVCEGSVYDVGPAVKGLSVSGNCVSWSDPCYPRLVLFGGPGSDCPITELIPSGGQVQIPASLKTQGCDRFSLRTADGKWALITSETADGQVIKEDSGRHAILLAP